MGEFRTVPVLGGTTMRRGGCTKGGPDHDNIIGEPFSIKKGEYTAFVQCACQKVSDEHGNHNIWWVFIETPLGRGWVSAVRIDEGQNDQPIDRVTKAATVFDAPGLGGPLRTVPIVKAGATLRLGGCDNSDPSNAGSTIGGGVSYTAFLQCPGEQFTDEHKNTNFWWVLLDTPHGPGWVSAVLIAEGGDNEPIRNVKQAPCVFSLPPDLLP